MLVVAAFYIIKFFGILGYGLADDSAIWGQFGDYMGGSLNPILSFISILLLIKSLNLQNQANLDLREELKDNKRTEKIKSFGSLFFNMIDSQKSLLQNFRLEFANANQVRQSGAGAIVCLEDEIENLRSRGANDTEITIFIEKIDSNDRIYGIVRAFSITVKIITEKLSDDNQFTFDDRKDHLLTLVNFTDFAQLRLILIAIQFMNYPATQYLRNNSDFTVVLNEVGLQLDLY
jgi:hypothetical protein